MAPELKSAIRFMIALSLGALCIWRSFAKIRSVAQLHQSFEEIRVRTEPPSARASRDVMRA
jgi:hypothetical protein